jgi:glutathione S-transferase
VLELYQAEWCPHSHKVRRRLTELGVDFVARQVAAKPEDRDAMRAATGTDEIPTLLPEDGSAITGEAAILGYLDDRFEEPREARRHRAQERAHGG